MKNRDLQATWTYHDGTKHSYHSIQGSRHYLDWDNQPIPFKIYPRLEPIPVPKDLVASGMPALRAVSTVRTGTDAETIPDLNSLADILFLSAGITKRKRYVGGEILFRAAACTGALYHIDLYVVCGDLPGLEAGVYHFGPHDFSLRRLRKGDYRGVLVRAMGHEPSMVNAPAVVVCGSTYWRNAWKYQARTYRHCFWDNGTILANLLAAAVSRKTPARVVLGFADATVNQLLGLDTEREAAVSLVALGYAPAMAAGTPPEPELLALETVPLSKSEVDYPTIRAMHEASSMESEAEVVAWRKGKSMKEEEPEAVGASTVSSAEPRKAEGEKGQSFALRPLSDDEIPRDTIEEVILRRGSTRQFARESITLPQLSTMLDRATRGLPADFIAPGTRLNDLYLIVHAVDDLTPGAYVFHRESLELELLREGNFRREAGYLGLGQEIPADCSVDVFFLADLDPVLERFGNRGYRAAQLEASITGGKFYLSAYAQRLGASGLTFFDDDVTEFFSPHALGKSVMFLIALGKSVKRRT